MKPWIKWLLVTLLVGLPALPLGQLIWRAASSSTGPTPQGFQVVLLMVMGLVEALSFGFGVAFVIFGFASIRRLSGKAKGLAWATYLSISWALVSWWPHSNLHRANSDINGLIAIEYAFHFTLVICAVTVAFFFTQIMAKPHQLE